MALANAGIARDDIASPVACHLDARSSAAALRAAARPSARPGQRRRDRSCRCLLRLSLCADARRRLRPRAWPPVLVVAANILSRRINPAERASAVLFADAAGAVVLGPCEDPKRGILGAIVAIPTAARYGPDPDSGRRKQQAVPGDLDREEILMTMHDGREVFAQAVEMMTACSKRALAQAGIAAAGRRPVRSAPGQCAHFRCGRQ